VIHMPRCIYQHQKPELHKLGQLLLHGGGKLRGRQPHLGPRGSHVHLRVSVRECLSLGQETTPGPLAHLQIGSVGCPGPKHDHVRHTNQLAELHLLAETPVTGAKSV
jgi:hypothetical protein